MRAMERRRLALAIAALVAVFAAGFLSARLLAPPAAPAPPASSDRDAESALRWPAIDGGLVPLVLDASAGEPKILFDPDSIQLLPDASLRLDLPPGFDDGGAPE